MQATVSENGCLHLSLTLLALMNEVFMNRRPSVISDESETQSYIYSRCRCCPLSHSDTSYANSRTISGRTATDMTYVIIVPCRTKSDHISKEILTTCPAISLQVVTDPRNAVIVFRMHQVNLEHQGLVALCGTQIQYKTPS